ncbi:MAG: hypothetical protein H7336_16655 [Bacteriovorax sp.]|nr:hypothetical protein [Bacteriovorax sp.]
MSFPDLKPLFLGDDNEPLPETLLVKLIESVTTKVGRKENGMAVQLRGTA